MGHPNEVSAMLLTMAVGCGAKEVHVPLEHREAGVSCPQQRNTGPSGGGCYCGDACTCWGMLNDGGPCSCGTNNFECQEDSQCDAGPNGRCGPFAFLPTLTCSYDQCFSDSDCDARVPCACRASGLSNEPNTCLTLSNCRLDSDCGPGGYCSPSVEGLDLAYFCHTSNDACTNGSDCPTNRPDCLFDSVAGHWACTVYVVRP